MAKEDRKKMLNHGQKTEFSHFLSLITDVYWHKMTTYPPSFCLPTFAEAQYFRQSSFPQSRKPNIFANGSSLNRRSPIFSSMVLPTFAEAQYFRQWSFPHSRKANIFVNGPSHICGSRFFSTKVLPTSTETFCSIAKLFCKYQKERRTKGHTVMQCMILFCSSA